MLNILYRCLFLQKKRKMKKIIILAIATTACVIWLGYLLLAALYGQYMIAFVGLAILILAFRYVLPK